MPLKLAVRPPVTTSHSRVSVAGSAGAAGVIAATYSSPAVTSNVGPPAPPTVSPSSVSVNSSSVAPHRVRPARGLHVDEALRDREARSAADEAEDVDRLDVALDREPGVRAVDRVALHDDVVVAGLAEIAVLVAVERRRPVDGRCLHLVALDAVGVVGAAGAVDEHVDGARDRGEQRPEAERAR